MASFNSVSAITLRSAGLKFCLLALALVTMLLPVTASAQQTFTGAAIAVGRTQTTPSSGTITISSPTGSSIATLKIVLNGLTTDGTACADDNCWSLLPTSFYLKAPNGGPKLVLLGGVGDGIDGDDAIDPGSGLVNAKVTIQDGATAAPNDTAISPQGGTFTYAPSSYFLGAGQTPPLGSEADFPQSDGSATLTSRFGGIGIANGDQWTLEIANGEGLTTPINISSWEMIVTYASTTPTSTAVASSQNPAFTTSPNNTVSLTATVSTSSGTPTGTVAFTDNGTTISGCGAVALSSGHATCNTTALAQGYHDIEAAYGGGGGFGQSSGSVTQLIEVHPTQSSNTWCNTTSFTAPLNETSIVYPAVIPVSGYGAGSTVGNVTIELQNVTEGAPGAGIDAEFLLVAPGGAHNLDFLDEGFNTEASGAVNLFISDSGSNTPNQGTPITNLTYIPYDGESNSSLDIFPASNSPIVDSNIPLVPGTINFAAPHGKTNSFTLQQAFNGAPANGDWALYATAWNGSDALTVGGWCVTLDVNSGVGTTTSLSSSAQKANLGSNVTLTATVTVQGTSTSVTSGTVEFKDETTGSVLASANTLNGSGVATVTVSNLAEGDHNILASYSGTGSFNTSFATIYQRIDKATGVTAVNSNTWQFCNTGAITLPEGTSGAETPNPSNIFVSNLPGTVNTATLSLNNFSILVGDQLDNTASLVVGPTGAALDFFSNTAAATIEDEALAGTYTFADSASGLVSSGSGNLNPGTYKPTSYVGTDNANDIFTADVGGFFTLPGTFGYSASRGSSTFASRFDGTNPNGTWSLYFNSPNANANGTGAAGGWCVNLTQNLPTVSVTKAHSGDFSQGESNAAFTVVIDNNGTNGPTGDPTGTNPMTVKDTLNSAFTYSGFSGTNWSCSAVLQAVTCTNDSAIAQGSSYPTLTINVNVASNAPASVTNSVTASGAGVASTSSNTDTISVDQAPTITSANNATFSVGTAGSFTVTTTGSPTPGISESGGLPSGVTFTDNGNGTATLSGTPAAGTGGVYAFTITASNSAPPNATQNFTLTVNQAPAITSANSATFTSGTLGSFTVTTSGHPTAGLSESGALPPGVTFTDNGNGTATIAGTASLATSYSITITASNGVSPNANQSFTLTVNPGAATQLVIPGGPEPFYTAFGFTITAEDAAGNVATSYNGTVAFTSSDPGFVNLGPVTLVNGQGSQTGVLKTAGTDSITATDTTNPSITGTGFFTIQPGVATHIGLVAPASAYVGSPISLTLTAYDLYGNVATSYGGTVAFTSTDPNAILPGSTSISNGTGTVSATMGTVGNQTITATDAGNSLSASTGNISVTLPTLVVTAATEDPGFAGNCSIQTTPGTGTDPSCSLRDALLFAANEGSGNITFDSTAFASAQTITLSNGTLTIPTNTVITGPTSGSGYSLTNLVTVDGGGAANNSPVFTVNTSAANAIIANLIITDGNFNGGTAAGIVNGYQAALTVMNSTISGNTAPTGTGAIFNDYNATLNVTGSTISNNTGGVGGIENESGGTVTVTNSTISGNTATGSGGGIVNSGTALTVTASTISGNSAASDAGGILSNSGILTLANSIVSLNTAPTNPDIDGTVVDNGGNQISASGIGLSSLASFGGPTQTLLPLPGGTAICTGTTANAFTANLTTDQRGLPFDPACLKGQVDSGAVQTNYAITFSVEPSTAYVHVPMSPAPQVQVTESGAVATAVTSSVSISGNPEALTGTTSASFASGLATFSNLVAPSTTPSEVLTATLALNSTVSVTANSAEFEVDGDTPATLSSPEVGSPLTSPSVTFSWQASPGATGYVLSVGTTGVASFNLYYSGLVTATSETVSQLPTNGETIYVRLFTDFNGTWVHQDYTFTTATLSMLTSPTPSSTLSGPIATFTWNGVNGATGYLLSIGSTGAGSYNLYYSGQIQGTSTTATELPTNGETLYVRLFTNYNGIFVHTDYTFTAATVAVIIPAPNSTFTGPSVAFTWAAMPNATGYVLQLGSSGPGSYDLYYSGQTTSTSATANQLPTNGETIYARLNTNYSGTWVHTDYTYTAATQAAITSPTPSTTLTGPGATFTWTTASGATAYALAVGSTGPGSYDLYYSGSQTATSATVGTLPNNGETIYVRLSTNYNGTWVRTDYTYTAP